MNNPYNPNTTGQNLYPQAPPPVIYQPAQPVPIQTNAAPQVYPSPYVAGQPVAIQNQQANNQPKVIIIDEKTQRTSSGNCCYCQGIKNSPCGCCDYPQEYCCFLVCMGYILMSLRYILMCLCILTYCRRCYR